MKTSESINKTQKTLKEATKMKKTILTTVLTITVLFIFSTVSYAQVHSNHAGFNAMAALAEKENRAKEQKATADKDKKTASKITVVDDDEKKHLICPKETGREKEMKC
ncbi:MAG: hypothetical protein ABFR82_05015 [Nitrospirota bacterium]